QPSGLLEIQLGTGNDTLSFGTGGLPDDLLLLVTGNGSTSTLVGSAVANDWQITAPNAGILNDNLFFQNVGNLTGAAGFVDSFTFLPGSSLNGSVTGQAADADTILTELAFTSAPQTLTYGASTSAQGTVTVNGSAIVNYVNIQSAENVQINGPTNAQMTLGAGGSGQLVLSSGNAGLGSITLDQPTSLALSLGTGDNTVTVNTAGLTAAVSVVGGGGTDKLVTEVVAVPAPTLGSGTFQAVSQTVTSADAGSITVKSTDVFSNPVSTLTISYSGIVDAQNLIIDGTAQDDSMSVIPGSGGNLEVVGDSFRAITFFNP